MENITIGIIPARFDSNRFPGKPLADICGKPMIQRVYEQTKKAGIFKYIIIGTDEDRIAGVCQNFLEGNDEVIISNKKYESGSDRIADIVDIYKLQDYDTVVNVQGDNPIINPKYLRDLAEILELFGDMATLACPITDRRLLLNENVVKVVTDIKGDALYFSRSCIPGGELIEETKKELNLIPRLKHIGIYAYKVWFLKRFKSLPVGKLEAIEKLEQLRVLENGYRIKVLTVKEDCPDVNTPYDIRIVEEIINEQRRKR